MLERKPKFAGKQTKWEKRRIARQFARAQQLTKQGKKKKALVEPLTIAPFKERMNAFNQGKMVFYDAGKRIVLPLVLKAIGKFLFLNWIQRKTLKILFQLILSFPLIQALATWNWIGVGEVMVWA